MDLKIDGMKEIKLNFRSIGFGDGSGLDCLRVEPAKVNALRRSRGTFVTNRATISLSRMAVLQILV